MPRKARKVQPWDAEGVSKSTYYRHKRKPAPSVAVRQAARARALVEGPQPSVSERTREEATASYRARHAEENVIARISAAVRGERLRFADMIINGACHETGDAIVEIRLPVEIWRTVTEAMR